MIPSGVDPKMKFKSKSFIHLKWLARRKFKILFRAKRGEIFEILLCAKRGENFEILLRAKHGDNFEILLGAKRGKKLEILLCPKMNLAISKNQSRDSKI